MIRWKSGIINIRFFLEKYKYSKGSNYVELQRLSGKGLFKTRYESDMMNRGTEPDLGRNEWTEFKWPPM